MFTVCGVGYDSSGDNGYFLDFTIDAGYSSFSSVSSEYSSFVADLYLCACVIDEDCPVYFTHHGMR